MEHLTLMYVEICSTWCPWAAREQPAPQWASPGLQGSAALHLEHLSSFFCTDLWGCWAASLLFLIPLSQLLLCSFSLSSICSPTGTTRIAHASALPSSGSLLGQLKLALVCHRALLGSAQGPLQQFPALLVLSLQHTNITLPTAEQRFVYTNAKPDSDTRGLLGCRLVEQKARTSPGKEHSYGW